MTGGSSIRSGGDVCLRRRCIEEAPDDDLFARNVSEDSHKKVRETGLNRGIHGRRRTVRPSQNVVVLLAIFDLFHQTDHVAVHDLTRSEAIYGSQRSNRRCNHPRRTFQ